VEFEFPGNSASRNASTENSSALEGISALFQPKKGLLFGQKEAKIDLNYINKDSVTNQLLLH
jgi:hypothetical protein